MEVALEVEAGGIGRADGLGLEIGAGGVQTGAGGAAGGENVGVCNSRVGEAKSAIGCAEGGDSRSGKASETRWGVEGAVIEVGVGGASGAGAGVGVDEGAPEGVVCAVKRELKNSRSLFGQSVVETPMLCVMLGILSTRSGLPPRRFRSAGPEFV